LERALRFVDRSVPSETTALEQLLARKEISLRPFRLEGLLTAAEVLRKKRILASIWVKEELLFHALASSLSA
jgi:hypothetical protein